MSAATVGPASQVPPVTARIARKVWREVFRPMRRLVWGIADEPRQEYLTGSGAGVAGFHPHQATVEAEAIPFIQRLVRESRAFPGSLVEIGTLLGVTTTNMALAKAPWQQLITVDLYSWNPWDLAPDVHEALTGQVLCYLEQTGQVKRLRMDKNEFYRTYQGAAPSMVFLDAVHDYEETKKDIEWARRIGAKIIAGHDYCDEFPGVKQIVDEMGGPRELCSSVWVL